MKKKNLQDNQSGISSIVFEIWKIKSGISQRGVVTVQVEILKYPLGAQDQNELTPAALSSAGKCRRINRYSSQTGRRLLHSLSPVQ